MNDSNAGACMGIFPRLTFRSACLIAWLLAAGCAAHADPPSALEGPAPPITLGVGAERAVCILLRNDSGAQVELRSLLVSKIRSKQYQIVQECDKAGYVLDIHVVEIRRSPESGDSAHWEDYPSGGGPVLGLGVGSGMGGRGGVRVGAGLGFLFPIDTRPLSPPPGYAFIMIAELEAEEATELTRTRQRTQLRIATSAPSEAAALPRLEEKMAEALSAILP
jgi:hypothetical protein